MNDFDNRANIDDDEESLFDNPSENDLKKEQIINELIDEFKENRIALKTLIVDLEKLKERIDSIFPQNLDARYMRFFEDKIKAATQLFSAILEIRKEIAKGLKTEIELRNNNTGDDNKDIMISQEELRSLSNKIESFNKLKKKNDKKLKIIDKKEKELK